MAPAFSLQRAFDGSGIDGSWFTAVTDFARHTTWLNGTAEAWTHYGLGVFAVLMIVGWWQARRSDAATMTAALAAPVCVVAAFVVAEVVKSGVAELRPCRSMPHAFIVETCPAPNDYAFPSGHTTVAAATAAALYLVNRKLCAIAALFALIESATRAYVGAHYPHDVAGSLVLGLLVALAVSAALQRLAAGRVETLRTGRLRPLLATSWQPPTRERRGAAWLPSGPHDDHHGGCLERGGSVGRDRETRHVFDHLTLVVSHELDWRNKNGARTGKVSRCS